MAFPAWGPAGPGAASAWVQSAELGLPTDLSRAVRRAPAVPDSEPLGAENWELTLLVSPCAPGGHRAVTSGARRTAVSSGPPCHPAFPSAIHFTPRRLFHEASGLWFSRLGGRPALQGGCQATFLPGGPAAHCTPPPQPHLSGLRGRRFCLPARLPWALLSDGRWEHLCPRPTLVLPARSSSVEQSESQSQSKVKG